MRDEVLIGRIIKYCQGICGDRVRFGDSFDDFLDDPSYQRSCCMNLMQIGETASKLSDEFTVRYDDEDWIAIVGFRNIVAHKYEHLDYTMIWEIMTKDVPRLMRFCELILVER